MIPDLAVFSDIVIAGVNQPLHQGLYNLSSFSSHDLTKLVDPWPHDGPPTKGRGF